MNALTDPEKLVPEFEAACEAVKVKPRLALQAGGLDSSVWRRWKTGEASPTLKSLAKAQAGLRQLVAARQVAA